MSLEEARAQKIRRARVRYVSLATTARPRGFYPAFQTSSEKAELLDFKQPPQRHLGAAHRCPTHAIRADAANLAAAVARALGRYLSSVDAKSSGLKGGGVKAPPSELRKTVAENVRRQRNGLALSQEALAAEAGLRRTYIGAIERAERNLSLDNLERLATALQVPPHALLQRSVKE